MKLVIQIPCYNERNVLPQVLAELPLQVEGFDEVEILMIDDGSTDDSVTVAQVNGVRHVHRLNGHQGLARAFAAGILRSLELGADVIVNTDADNQYQSACIPDLIRPIVRNELDIAIGARPIALIHHFSCWKRVLQHTGSFIVRRLTGCDIRDAPSGFRAFSREAAMRLSVFGRFTYTIETTIQASLSGLRIGSVPIRVNGPTRPSRLFRSNFGYICRAAMTVLAAFAVYRPVLLLIMAGGFFLICCSVEFAFSHLSHRWDQDGEPVRKAVLGGVCSLCFFMVVGMGILAQLLSVNRRLLEEIRYRILCSEYNREKGRSTQAGCIKIDAEGATTGREGNAGSNHQPV